MLVPEDFNIGMLLANLRKDLMLDDEQSLFIYAQEGSKKRRLLRAGTPA